MSRKVLLVGGFGEGKTTLVKRVCKNAISYKCIENPNPENGFVMRLITTEYGTQEVWQAIDIAEVLKLESFDVVVFMFSYQHCDSLLSTIMSYHHHKNLIQGKCFVVGNKCDLGVTATTIQGIGLFQLETGIRVDHISAQDNADEQIMKFWKYLCA